MDPKKSVADQFSKLHPCFLVNTRIGIIGGGPSGLSAAYALSRLGYNNVTMLEKYHTERFTISEAKFLQQNSAPVIFNLAKEIGSELVELDSHKLALIDSSTGKYQDIKVADDYVSVISLTLELQDSGRIGVHAISDFASDLTPAFLEDRGFKSVPKSVAYGYTASGYGFVQDMPYAYIHEFTRTSMAGKIRRFKYGFVSLWQKISEALPVKVHCNSEVLAVRRSSCGVSVDVKNSCEEVKLMEFDKIIISGSFPFKNGKTYRSSQSNLAGLDHFPVGFYYFEEFMSDPATIGNPVAMQRFYGDTDIFLFWSYGNSADITGSKITELAIDAVKNMGGMVEKVILQRRFKYFPHEGFYDKVETQLQGQQNTYYVGGLMAFELTERNSSYAMALICKHFASDTSLLAFPYVKRLIPLQSDCWDRNPRELREYQGVDFPDLCSLDGYLKHWGTHKVTQNKILYTWINEEGGPANKRTYGELHANAYCIAQKLLGSQKPVINPGDRVLLVHVPGLDFVDAFFGCLRARVLPVPVLPPDPLQRGGQALLKIENIAKSCNAVAILSTVGYHGAVRAGAMKNLISLSGKNRKSSGKWPDLQWLHTDSWVKNSKNMLQEDMDDSEARASDLCFLQFTSGSTGDAKGVMITHGGLVHNVKLMRKKYKSTSKTVLVSWLPQYHDMGLIGGLFTAMVSGGSAVLFSPITFIKNPLLWLQIMSKYQATHSAGPNFAFELVVRRLEAAKDRLWNYDLSSMVFLMVAAEPVRQKTLKRFVELTSSFGLSQEVMAPGYGLAENCVFVSCAYGEGKPILVDWQGRVSCGYVNSDDVDVDIRIVDPETGVEHEEAGKEGEIWISSPSAGIGYWGREELSERTFRNVLQSCPSKRYTRTGDLGRIINGSLFITGRIKDLIIVAGRNIYSADVEKTVESSSELIRPGCCAVIGVPDDILSAKGMSVPDSSDQVGLVVIAEVRDGKPVPKDVIKQMQTRVAEEHGVTVASVKLIKPRTISKTTSGKIKRFECLKQFADGTLNLVPEPSLLKRSLVRSFTSGTCREGNTPRAQVVRGPLSPIPKLSNKEITEFLKGLVSEQTGISINKISINENLVAYGIDSIGVVRAAQKLSAFLGVPVGAVDIFTATCIEELASFSEDLLKKSQPQLTTTLSHLPEPEIDSAELMLGARIGSSVLLDTVDITDPSLVSIGDGAVIAEGALVQGHEVKNGILSFLPIRIGKNSSVGPYAVIQKGSVVGEEVEVPALQKTGAGRPASKSNIQKVAKQQKDIRDTQAEVVYHFMGIYAVVFLSSLSAAILYFLYIWLSQKPPSPQPFALFCIFGAFHWLPFAIIAYTTMIGSEPSSPNSFAISIAFAYICQASFRNGSLLHVLAVFGCKSWKHCSIRAINPLSEPGLISIGDGVHLGDFSRIIAGFYSSSGFRCGKVEVNDNSVVGSQSLVLPGSVVEKDVILGALSVAPMNSVLRRGGVYIGSQSPVMIKNTVHSLDERIEEMDTKYKKIVGNLAATTLKVQTRYFHRIGVSGKGVLKLYDNIKGLPSHKIFHPGKSYPIIVRHSNSLSADDDARIDARGAALRILPDETGAESSELPLLDLTLKTGNAFYARTISDFATWLVCGLPAREEHVKHAPHIRDAVWTSLRNANSYAELHYYSNICRLFRFTDGQEMYVKFKLRPSDEKISEDTGKVEPTGILPPETGAIPRAENDTRPLLFLVEDFQRRVNSPGGVHYIFQLQFRPIPQDAAARDIALDCSKPWDDTEFPFIDVGEIVLDQNLTGEQSEELVFNPFLRCPEIDVIWATSASQSASIDHGRSLIYEICQNLRNGDPLPESWRIFLQSDVKVNLSGCPMASALEKNETRKVTLARTWYQSLWAILAQPLLQTVLPYYLMGLVIFGPLSWVLYLKDTMKYPLHWLLPLFWVSSGILAAFACVVGKWVLVGKKKEGKSMLIWSSGVFMDTIWQAFRTVVGDYFMEMTGGSVLFVIWMNLMGSEIDVGAYVDSMEAVLNPEMVEIERGGCVGREALLFGHIYEGEGGRVKFGKISVGEGGFVGSRAVVMPGVRVETDGRLCALSLAMKEEIVKSR
ncbi:hypothetical protein Acr_23g0013760 [Actinidia rufa]|uniref:Carrier domain-containing protein n=1 Tax=Actinidia rufa TaxID=165716 RepID=A0A7J0GQD1_9ERIC|nr:hypothetical protein Acr_23g0013760 [Actinidia rufa]